MGYFRGVRRDIAYLFLILAVAFGVRVYPPWQAVLGGDAVDFLETDAWYHVRLIEAQVRNWPWRVTLDPYAAPGGQFVPIAPLFDTITATVVFGRYGRGAETASIERIAAFIPPVLGTLTIAVLWALARRVFDARAALLAAALLAILPGHFLDRTQLGFYDHHALEALLAMAVLWALARDLRPRGQPLSPQGTSVPAKEGRRSLAGTEVGIILGLYLLSWGSGGFLLAILAVWLVLLVPLARNSDDLSRTARVVGTAALVAFILVVVFQDPAMYRYESQILGLVALAGIALAIRVLAFARPTTASILGGVTLVGALVAGVLWLFAPGVITQFFSDLARLGPDTQRMAVLEARPLFMYPGRWNWMQPWEFFRTGFYIGLVALVVFTARVWRSRDPIDLAILVFTAATFAATIGQNRFAYYLVPACALVGGWLATEILDWRFPYHREIAPLLVAAAFFGPNLSPSLLTATRSGSFPAYWRQTMAWLREHTPPPFVHSAGVGDEYYYARYPRSGVPLPDYSVMNWWDHGYWINQAAHRVPVANPTQVRAPNAGRFYAATDEADAIAILGAERSRYVVADWELPFRLTPTGTVMGRFQQVIDWAGGEHAHYYQVFYRRRNNEWEAVWVFHEPYYRSMAYRLGVLGGAAGAPANSTSVIVVTDHTDESGLQFTEILARTTYATFDAAVKAAHVPPAVGRALIVGLDPWRPAFAVAPLTALRQAVRIENPRAETQRGRVGAGVRVAVVASSE